MRLVLACLVLLRITAATASADEGAPLIAPAAADSLHAANRLRTAGIAVLAAGVLATVASQVLLGEGIGWELGNGLGEHYDPTPSWVPRIETAGWTLLAGGQAAIVSGIVMLAVGDARRDRARAGVRISVAASPTGGLVTLGARF